MREYHKIWGEVQKIDTKNGGQKAKIPPLGVILGPKFHSPRRWSLVRYRENRLKILGDLKVIFKLK